MCENVSLYEARAFLEQNESRGFRCTFVPHDSDLKECHNQIHGKLIALELPNHTHETVTSCLMWQMISHLRSRSGRKASVDFKPSPTIQIEDTLKEPDLTMCPIGRNNQAQLPTVVFETGYLHESLQKLDTILGQWTRIAQLAVGIKIYKERNDEFQMQVVVHRKEATQNPDKIIAFGTDVTVQGLTLEISLADIYLGSENCQNDAIKQAIARKECLAIDLSELQERLIEVVLPF